MYPRVGEKRRLDDINLEDEEAIGSLCRLSGRPVSPKTAMEHEKRIRREIANSNERRRMQSINAGFASLKTLLPHHEGEKLSKAAILQQTAEYIYQLEQEKTRLLTQNCQLKRLLNQQHHSDPEGSPTGGDSPIEDRVPLAPSPSPVGVTTTITTTTTTSSSTLNTPIVSITNPIGGTKGANEPGDLRREMAETQIHVGDRDRRTRLKMEEHIRPMETDLYTHKTKEVTQVKLNYNTVDLSSGVKMEIKNEIEANNKAGNAPPSSALISEVKGDAVNGGAESILEYSSDVSDVHLQKTVLKTSTEGGVSCSRVPLSPVTSPTNLCVSHTNSAFRTPQPQQSSPSSILSPPTTIFTVLPSNKASTKVLPPVLELRGLSDVEAAEVTSPTTTVEYVEDGSVGPLRNHTVFIVNPSSSSCQKSLDTICEAIRHLEGDHMFPLDEQVVGASNIKEEVVTDETYTVEEDHAHHAVPEDIHHRKHLTTTYEGMKSGGGVIGPKSLSQSIHATHPLGGPMGHLTVHMIPSEPQEVPLELTTTHRATSEPPHQFVEHEVVCSSSQHSMSHQSTFLHHTTRPGVIVVKHQ